MYKTIECNYMATNKNINRIKVVLVEKKKTNKWLADQIGKDQATVSKWCTNTTPVSYTHLTLPTNSLV